MAAKILALRETAAGENRVSMTPETAGKLGKLGVVATIEAQAGVSAHFVDSAYPSSGSVALADADVVLCVQPPGTAQLAQLKPGAVLVGLLSVQSDPARMERLLAQRITAFSMERLPRTTRAQSMDVLSSQAGMAGYKAVMVAALNAPRFFPMLTTAAGTIRPSKVLVVGAGVAGLQAIATARRIGAQVEGFDVRPETREQIESLGARFLDLGVAAAGEGGYARELNADERAEQQRLLAEHLKSVDVIITTAAVPGRPAPRIITAAMVKGMRPGTVVVDLAAESGGNCELTRPGETVVENGVSIIGPLNLASQGAIHASEMYARNLFNFVALMIKDGALALDWDDELIAKSCVSHDGQSRL